MSAWASGPTWSWSGASRIPRSRSIGPSDPSGSRSDGRPLAFPLQVHRDNKLRTIPRNRTMEPWDVTIVGGGILGTSFAYWLANRYDGRIAVIEKEAQGAAHTSRRNTGVVHPAFTQAPREEAERAGAKSLLRSDVESIDVAGDHLEIRLARGTATDRVYVDPRGKIRVNVAFRDDPLPTRFLINAAGGHSIDIAHALGVGQEYTDLHFRGEYWEVGPEWHYLCGRNIYTVPRHPELPFLDPHWIVRADGRREIGPNAVPVPGPYTYRGLFDDPAEAVRKFFERPVGNKLAALVNQDFMTLATEEWASSISKRAMAKRVQEFLPALRVKYLTRPGTAGVRAQVVDRHGNFVKEAIEIPGPHSFHVVNYNSPGATGSPAYTAWIVQLLAKAGHLDHLKAKAAKPAGLWDFDAVCAAIEAPNVSA